MNPAQQPAARPPGRPHGIVRGLDKVPHTHAFEGRFGRLFGGLPPARHRDDDLAKLAAAMVAEKEAEQTPETADDDEENPGIAAGYTYFGQFIDHDLTFDPQSSLEKHNDPEALVDFRTPRFDLDNVYGRGPDDQPYLYQADGVRMLLGRPLTGSATDPNARDVQRNANDRALIGDPRNDENVIVSQLQAAVLRFHNHLADLLGAADGDHFADVQREVRWHYQWAVLHDFLPTVVGPKTVDAVLPHIPARKSVLHDRQPNLLFYKPEKEPFIPVEFSVAAYRFGHSMVRPVYRLNQTDLPGPEPRFTIFSADPDTSLTGFRKFREDLGIEWRLFFAGVGDNAPRTKTRVQPAYKIDTSLVNPLGDLPPSVASKIPSLALRNLLRGVRMDLPSGQAVAHRMGVPVIPDDHLRVGKANEDDTPTNPKLTDLSHRFKHNAPLWYYVLAEAQQQFKTNDTAIHLGPVGGRIVAEVFVGLMWYDRHSYLRQNPHWQPRKDLSKNGQFGIAELLAAAAKA